MPQASFDALADALVKCCRPGGCRAAAFPHVASSFGWLANPCPANALADALARLIAADPSRASRLVHHPQLVQQLCEAIGSGRVELRLTIMGFLMPMLLGRGDADTVVLAGVIEAAPRALEAYARCLLDAYAPTPTADGAEGAHLDAGRLRSASEDHLVKRLHFAKLACAFFALGRCARLALIPDALDALPHMMAPRQRKDDREVATNLLFMIAVQRTPSFKAARAAVLAHRGVIISLLRAVAGADGVSGGAADEIAVKAARVLSVLAVNYEDSPIGAADRPPNGVVATVDGAAARMIAGCLSGSKAAMKGLSTLLARRVAHPGDCGGAHPGGSCWSCDTPALARMVVALGVGLGFMTEAERAAAVGAIVDPGVRLLPILSAAIQQAHRHGAQQVRSELRKSADAILRGAGPRHGSALRAAAPYLLKLSWLPMPGDPPATPEDNVNAELLAMFTAMMTRSAEGRGATAAAQAARGGGGAARGGASSSGASSSNGGGAALGARAAGPSSSSAPTVAPPAAAAAAAAPGVYLSRCGGCGNAAPAGGRLRFCSGCRSVKYCSEECATSVWREHRPACKAVRAAKAAAEAAAVAAAEGN